MSGRVVDLAEKFAAFSEHWRPKIAAQLNGQDVRLVKIRDCSPGTATPTPKRCSWYGGRACGWSSATAS